MGSAAALVCASNNDETRRASLCSRKVTLAGKEKQQALRQAGWGAAAAAAAAAGVGTLGFFQLEMQGGIFQSCWSLTVVLRGGECMTGTGTSPDALGTFLCLNFGGSIGSIGMSCSSQRITGITSPACASVMLAIAIGQRAQHRSAAAGMAQVKMGGLQIIQGELRDAVNSDRRSCIGRLNPHAGDDRRDG